MFMGHMKNKVGKGGAPGTIRTNLAHVRKWIEVAYGNKIQIRLPKSFNYLVNPHKAYPEPDVLELIHELRFQPLKALGGDSAAATEDKGK